MFNCPFCQALLEPLPQQAGTVVICPQCNGQIQLPTAHQPAKVAIQREKSVSVRAETLATLIITAIFAFGLLVSIAFMLAKMNRRSHYDVDAELSSLPPLKTIPGVLPADIYYRFVEKGFALKEPVPGGSVWYCSERFNQREAMITIVGNNRKDVSGITATVTSVVENEPQDYAEYFFPLVADLEYPGANRAQAKQWVMENLGKDKVSTRIGEVQFELYAPTRFVRMLQISTKRIRPEDP